MERLYFNSVSPYAPTAGLEENYEANRQEYDSLLKECDELKRFLPEAIAFLSDPDNAKHAGHLLRHLTGDAPDLPTQLAHPEPPLPNEVKTALRALMKVDASSGMKGLLGLGNADYSAKICQALIALNERLHNWRLPEVEGVQGKFIPRGHRDEANRRYYFMWTARSAAGWKEAEIKVRNYGKFSMYKDFINAYEHACKYRKKEQKYEDNNLAICALELRKYPALFRLWGMQPDVAWTARGQYHVDDFMTPDDYKKWAFFVCVTPELEARMKFMVSFALSFPDLAKQFDVEAQELMTKKYAVIANEKNTLSFSEDERHSAVNALQEIEKKMRTHYMTNYIKACLKMCRKNFPTNLAREIAKY